MDPDTQGELFGAEEAPNLQPDPDKVRAQLQAILAEVRSAKVIPWEARRLKLYRTIFPQMSNWLPDREAKQLCFEFKAELARLRSRLANTSDGHDVARGKPLAM